VIINGSMLGSVVLLGLLRYGYDPEFAAVRSGENDFAVLAYVDGFGSEKDLTSMIAKILLLKPRFGGYRGRLGHWLFCP
jgi:hypothetical protein